MTDLHDYSAVKLRALIGAKIVSPTEVVEHCIGRIEKFNSVLVAFCDTCFDRALSEAQQAEKSLMAGNALPPLFGLPVGIKDMNDVEGLATTYGSYLYQNNIADSDEFIVAKLRSQGAIVIGKTNIPELGFGATSANPLWGTTCNPHDTSFTSAGSSGGSAVALAAGLVPLAMGSDFAGSLRTPASFNGITGVRPSAGTVPNERRAFGFSPFNVEGPLGREAKDARMLLASMATTASFDPLSYAFDTRFESSPGAVDLSSLNVAVSEDLGFAPVDNAVRQVFREKLSTFGRFFKNVETAHPDLSTVNDTLAVMRSLEFVHDFKSIYDDDPDSLSDNVVLEVEQGMKLGIDDIAGATAEHTLIYRASQQFFEQHDLLITPAASVAPFKHEAEWPRQINGEDMPNYLRWEAIAYGVTLMGNPAVVIPAGTDQNGLPFGIQIIGKLHHDAWLCDVAVMMESLFEDIDSLRRPRVNEDLLNGY